MINRKCKIRFLYRTANFAACVSVLLLSSAISLAQAQIVLNIPADFSRVKGGQHQGVVYSQDGTRLTQTLEITDFVISRFEVSFLDFQKFSKATGYQIPAQPKRNNPKLPVVYVNYHDAEAYCDWLSKIYQIQFRLPTLEEWEFAAQGGLKSHGYIYSGSNDPKEAAVYIVNSEGPPQCSKCDRFPNELGIYHMSGNVWEWVERPLNSKSYVAKGGSIFENSDQIKIKSEARFISGTRRRDLGFRIAADAESYNNYVLAQKINVLLRKLYDENPPITVDAGGFSQKTKKVAWETFDNFFIDMGTKKAGVVGVTETGYQNVLDFEFEESQFKTLSDIRDLIQSNLRNTNQ